MEWVVVCKTEVKEEVVPETPRTSSYSLSPSFLPIDHFGVYGRVRTSSGHSIYTQVLTNVKG